MLGLKCFSSQPRKPHDMGQALRFWRLFTDCERLTQDEWVALRDRDFEAVARIQAAKAALLPDLQSLGGDARRASRDEGFTNRFAGLIAAEERNLSQIQSMLREARIERLDLSAARQRLRELAAGYGSNPPLSRHFLAHG